MKVFTTFPILETKERKIKALRWEIHRIPDLIANSYVAIKNRNQSLPQPITNTEPDIEAPSIDYLVSRR